jgi:hypothetical protein
MYLSSVIAVYPRFSFFHFQPALALSIVALTIGISGLKSRQFMLVYMCTAIVSLYIVRPYLFASNINETRFFASSDFALSSTIQSIIPAQSSVYYLNIPSQQYVLTDTVPPHPWLDNYGWYFEMPEVESHTLTLWNQNPPQYIVWKEKNDGNWYDIGVYEPKSIVNWIQNNYVQELNIGDRTWIWKRKH